MGLSLPLRVGSDDVVYLLWSSTVGRVDGAPERICFSRSTDRGRTYSAPQDVSRAPAGTEHAFPSLAVGREAGDVRIGWMDVRTGAWNVFYRASEDGGRSFGPTARVSTFAGGYAHLDQPGSPCGTVHRCTGEILARPPTGLVESGLVW